MKKSIIAGSFIALGLIFSGLANGDSGLVQKPFDGVELNKFMEDYPGLTQWKPAEGSFAGNLNNPWVMAGMQYDKGFGAALSGKGWQGDRFFYLLNHVRQGVMAERHRLHQQKSEERINRQMADMAAKMNAQQAAFKKQSQKEAKRAQAWIKDQLAAQKKQVEDNPYMHPLQKKNILAFLNRSNNEANWVSAPDQGFQQAQAQAAAQRKAWESSYRQSIQNNPHIPPQQKKLIFEGMDRANQPVAALEPVKMPTQEEMMVRMQNQRKAWISEQIQQVNNNPAYSDEQKKNIVKRLSHFNQRMVKGAHRNFSTLPGDEESLIKKNISRLVGMLKGK